MAADQHSRNKLCKRKYATRLREENRQRPSLILEIAELKKKLVEEHGEKLEVVEQPEPLRQPAPQGLSKVERAKWLRNSRESHQRASLVWLKREKERLHTLYSRLTAQKELVEAHQMAVQLLAAAIEKTNESLSSSLDSLRQPNPELYKRRRLMNES